MAVWWPEELELPPDIILNLAHQTHQATLPGLRVKIHLLLLGIGKHFSNLALGDGFYKFRWGLRTRNIDRLSLGIFF